MPFSITLVRHARSEANAAGIWQGQGDSVLAPEGRDQAKLLGARLGTRGFDVVVSSDLSRTQETAGLAGFEPALVEKQWREMDLGGWEGRTFADVAEEHPDLLEAIRNGDSVTFGGTGETIAELEERSVAAFESVVERLDGEGHAIVFTHGAVIDSIVGQYFGRRRGARTFPITTNTALTTFIGDQTRSHGRPRIATFNDATHLGHDVGAAGHFRSSDTPIVGFVRHGVTEANQTGRIQGQQCWGLHPDGVLQAKRFADWYGVADRVLASPLRRAMETAAEVRSEADLEPHDLLKEQSFGAWEGLLRSEMSPEDLEVMRRIYVEGEDLPRGGTGETFAALIDRLSGFLTEFDPRPERTVVVSHGAAIKALVAGVLGNQVDIQSQLAVPANTSVSHVAFPEQGPMLIDYAVAPHLETE